MSGAEHVIRHVLVRGRVQGVGFRAFAEATAGALELVGWVRNRRDGGVELVVRGPAPKVTQMIEFCRRGPPGARVDHIDVRPAGQNSLGDQHSEFLVLPTA
jgi:acylphosphatase